jgi:hypothetical protein
MFADMRRAGMGVGVSKSKLTRAMLEILVQLPPGTTDLKETIVAHLGLLGQMAATRDINAAWNDAKKQAAREYPDKFILDSRKVLHWNDGSVKVLDKDLSAANLKKLNELAAAEQCSVNQIVSKLIQHYKRQRVK